MIAALNVRLVLLLNDLWMLRSYMRVLPRYRDQVKVVAYLPLDGTPPDDALVAPLTAVDRFVAYTEFGRAEIGGALTRLRMQGADIRSTDVAVIPHGVDTAPPSIPSRRRSSGRSRPAGGKRCAGGSSRTSRTGTAPSSSSTPIARWSGRLYVDQEYRTAMSLAAYRGATQPMYHWDRIAAQWRRLFDDLRESCV
jgi:hypothetical protein